MVQLSNKNSLIVFSIVNASCQQACSPIPENFKLVSEGSYVVDSKQVGDTYDIYVQLPASYDTSSAKKYPLVVYADINLYGQIMLISTKLRQITMKNQLN